jgi:hypothetical protein
MNVNERGYAAQRDALSAKISRSTPSIKENGCVTNLKEQIPRLGWMTRG